MIKKKPANYLQYKNLTKIHWNDLKEDTHIIVIIQKRLYVESCI